MENISIAKLQRMRRERSAMLLTFVVAVAGLISGAAIAQQAPVLQLQRHSVETPLPPHFLHWLQTRSFSVGISRGISSSEEKNGASNASFEEAETHFSAAFGRQVNPSLGMGLTLANVRASSSFQSEDGGLTSDVDRQVRSSIGSAEGSFKIMDMIVIGLRLGYQVSQLSFTETDEETYRATILGSALAWKANQFEAALFQSTRFVSRNDFDGKKNNRQYTESGVLISGRMGNEPQWQLWAQRNPLPVCCAFTHSSRMVYGGKMFFGIASWIVSPGYRYLSEFQTNQKPGTIEDAARHNLFVDGVTGWEEWIPGVNISYEMAARKTAPSSFRNGDSSRSDVEASRLSFTGSWGRTW